MQSGPRLVSLLLALGIAVAACGKSDKSSKKSDDDDDASAKPKSSAMSAADAAAQASAAVAKAKEEADPAVIAELKKFQSCSFKDDEGFGEGCAASENDGFQAFTKKYTDDDSDDEKKTKKLVRSCLSLGTDADPKLRLAAADCISDFAFSIRKDKAAAAFVLMQLENEKVEAVRNYWSYSVSAFELGDDNAVRAVDLIKKFKGNEKERDYISSIFNGLKSWDGEPPGVAIDEALALATHEDGSIADAAIGLLEGVEKRAPEACKVMTTVIKAKKNNWTRTAFAMSKLKNACKSDYDSVLAVMIEKLAEDSSAYGKGVSGGQLLYIRWFAEKAELSKDQKRKLITAVEARGKNASENDKEQIDKLLAVLKK